MILTTPQQTPNGAIATHCRIIHAAANFKDQHLDITVAMYASEVGFDAYLPIWHHTYKIELSRIGNMVEQIFYQVLHNGDDSPLYGIENGIDNSQVAVSSSLISPQPLQQVNEDLIVA